jgi:hypothetical protein
LQKTMMGITKRRRSPKALAGLWAAALAVVAVSATLNAQTLQAPVLALRPVTTGDLALYKLPATVQVSGGLTTLALGEPWYLEVQVDATLTAKQIGSVTWTLVVKPAGSNAQLVASPLTSSVPVYEPSDRLIYQVADRKLLRPDVAGVYIVSAEVTAGGSSPTTVAQTYTAATYMGITTCAECHNTGPAEKMVAAWETTLHSQIFTSGINGGSGTTGASCLPCHTVGYDSNNSANDGGFGYLMQQLKWTFPTTLQAGNWNKVPVALQNVANIQCENCHGPGSGHAGSGGDTSAISIPQNTGQCNQCHDDPTHHFKGTAWENSMHAVTTTDPAGNATCVGCHTGTGFIQRMNGISPITDTSYHPVDCAACHEPHGITATGTTHQIRNMISVTLGDGTTVPLTGNDSRGYAVTAGEGILCMQCHQARVNASTYVNSTAGSAHYGPHEGPQADMLMGTNGYTYGQSIPTSAHQFVVPNTCVTCHMQEVATTDPGFLHVGDHTFTPSYTPTGGQKEMLVAACQTCHGPDVTTFDFPLFDYNGDGVIQGVQTEVQSLLDKLSTLLPPNNSVKTSLSIDSTWNQHQLQAAYNWQFVNNDGSRGIHNTAYAVGLLKASIEDLQAQH